METVIPRLHATAPQPLSFAPKLGVRNFLLERDEGNLLVYSSTTVRQEADYIQARGGIWRQYLNHGHEAWVAEAAGAWVASTFGAPLHAHENEKEEVSRAYDVDGTFSERHTVGDDFEVIPIPGHTRGATAFLWDTGEHRILFTGDSIVLEESAWVAALLPSSDREDYIKSLELIRGLDFDVIVPWAASLDGAYYAFTDKGDTERRIDEMLERMRATESPRR
jgi:glyoxylase-like metal-dependent hydrolase (beta-lactamase superfamily II)